MTRDDWWLLGLFVKAVTTLSVLGLWLIALTWMFGAELRPGIGWVAGGLILVSVIGLPLMLYIDEKAK